MKPPQLRSIVRLVHLVLGVSVAALVYMPLSWVEPARPLVGAVAVPLIVLSGLFMWQQGTLRRLRRRRRREGGAHP